MILQELRKLSHAAGWQESGGFADKTVHFLLMITPEGEPLRKADGSLDCWFPLLAGEDKHGKASLGRSYADRPESLRRNQSDFGADCFVGRADRLVLARVEDNAGKCRQATAQLAADKSEVIIGLLPVRQFYERLLRQDGTLAGELRKSLVEALVPFQPKPRPGKLPKLKLPDLQEIALCITTDDRRPVFDMPAVRTMWRGRSAGGSASAVFGDTHCLCCGLPCTPDRIHKRVIKGLPGPGSKGVSLMSYNKDPFQSHGLQDCFNAPMCRDCVDSYTIALNNLLKNKPPRGGGARYGGSEKLAGLAFVYWFRNPDSLRPIDRVLNGVKHLEQRFGALQTGSDLSVQSRANRFFLAVMSAPNPGRAAIHDWFDESLERVDANLAEWFESTEIIRPYGGKFAEPVRLADPGKGVKGAAWAEIMDRHIPSALGREIKDREKIRRLGMKWDVQKDTILAVFERALLGRTLPLSIAHSALDRLREGIHDAKEKKRSALPGFTTARLGLMKAVLNDHPEVLHEGRPIMAGLERDRGDPAYVCGRLLAILSRIQAKATSNRGDDEEKERKLCANVVSRYYGAASSRPATGLYLPLRMHVHHLSKLDRDDPAEATLRRKDLQETMHWVSNLPRTLSPAQQCVFAIGFEHQMAEFFRKKKNEGTARKQADTTLDTGNLNTEGKE